MVLVGNTVYEQEEREVIHETAEALASSFNMFYFETDVKLNTGVQELTAHFFETVVSFKKSTAQAAQEAQKAADFKA